MTVFSCIWQSKTNRICVQIIPYNDYIVYLCHKIYYIRYDKSNPCTSDLREKELLFWLHFRHLRRAKWGRGRDHQKQSPSRRNDRWKLQNHQTGNDYTVAFDTEQQVRIQTKSMAFSVPMECHEKCHAFCHAFFSWHFLYRWFYLHIICIAIGSIP